MFAVSLKRVYYVCDKAIVRSIRNRRLPPSNPGIQQRINAFRQEGLRVQENDADEFVEQSESDFYNAGQAYDAHLNETLIGKFEVRHHIIKEKYFKENMPNLLTWSEKEQIRHLAATNSTEWTPERIAESFPVTAAVAKKLLNFTWKPATEERIARHDASAMRNWKQLKDGSFGIPEELRQHFLKFAERTIPPLPKKSVKYEITQEKLGEFERIIKKCASNEEQESQETESNSQNQMEEENKSKSRDFKRITLDDLTDRIKQRIDKGSNVTAPDQLMLDTVKESKLNIAPIEKNDIELYATEHKDELIEYKKKDEEVTNVMKYPKRIRIPKKVYQRGATYKVNDCYYDDDGRFLYRVLGMSN